MLKWLWEFLLHLPWFGHKPMNPRWIYTDDRGRRHWIVSCEICGQEYEDMTG